jgi:hypothetical protein
MREYKIRGNKNSNSNNIPQYKSIVILKRTDYKNLTKIKMVAVLFKIIYFVRERLLRVYLH